jgi:hypothetical protein
MRSNMAQMMEADDRCAFRAQIQGMWYEKRTSFWSHSIPCFCLKPRFDPAGLSWDLYHGIVFGPSLCLLESIWQATIGKINISKHHDWGEWPMWRRTLTSQEIARRDLRGPALSWFKYYPTLSGSTEYFTSQGIHSTLRMGIHHFIGTVDNSMTWSSRSPHVPISSGWVSTARHRSHGTRDVLNHLPFDGCRESLFTKSAADINLLMHFNSRGLLPTYEARLSLLYVVRMPIIFSPGPCSAYNFLEVFSASNLLLG